MEALYAPDGSPVVVAHGRGVGAGARGRAAAGGGGAGGPRPADTLYGAWLAGACLGATTMGLHHKLCHVLGGTFGLPHAPTHAVVLPHVAAFNLPAAPDAAAALGRALGDG